MAPQARERLPEGGKKPRPARAGSFKAWFWAIIALAVAGCAIFWLTRSPEKQEELRSQAADMVNDATKGTPLAGIGEILRSAPPPPPPIYQAPPTEPGTLAGREVTGEIPQETAPDPASPDEPSFVDEPEPVTEDQEVKPLYLAQTAQWLASRYRPASGGIDAPIQNVNQYCGVTIAQEAKGGRSGLLRYVFQPSMINGLYRLYIDRFMEDLNAAAAKRGLSAAQNRQFHKALAGRAALWAAAVESAAEIPDLLQKLHNIETATQNEVELNYTLTTTLFELDDLREAKAGKQQIDAVTLRAEGAAARYRRASEDRVKARRSLITAMRKNSGNSLDDDSLMFVAAWAGRRLAENSDSAAALTACAEVLRDFARRCAQFASAPTP